MNRKLKDKFEALRDGKFENQTLYESIDLAMDALKSDPDCGIKIPKKLWPKVYIKKYGITNLWKYNLPSSWRLIYTIETDEITIMSIILEWFDHKQYKRRFNY